MSYSKLDVEGPAPFKESGVYEVQISITGYKPSEDEIKNKTFSLGCGVITFISW
jgi:integrin beta 3/collagen type V/XI/XXIV/XXVII alpha